MSHITQAQQGLAAAEARKYDEAVTKLSAALQVSANPAWLIARSKALISLGRFQEALEDANLAWHTAYQRNKRDLLIEAHYRRAVAYFRLRQYANADACCIYSMRLAKGLPALEKEDAARKSTDENGFYTVTLEDAKHEAQNDEYNASKGDLSTAIGDKTPPQAKEWRRASTLRMQILFAMDKLLPDDPARKLTTSTKPEEKSLADLGSKSGPEPGKPAVVSPAATQPAAKPSVPGNTPVRLQEFQNDATMSVSVFSKGVNKEKLQVKFLPFAVELDPIIYPSGEEKAYRLDLWGEIDPSTSKHTVTPSKVELSLKKKAPGKWPQLKGEVKQENVSEIAAREQAELDFLKEARKKAMQASEAAANEEASKKESSPEKTEAAKSAGPSYPTSSRSGPKDWDALVNDEDDDDGKDVNVFFKSLFKNATPEQQRAMMKSFTESNGTSLSTNWDDVKDRTVETVPPDGVEAKKWD